MPGREETKIVLDERQRERFRDLLSLPAVSDDSISRLLATRAVVLGVRGSGASAVKSLKDAGVPQVAVVLERGDDYETLAPDLLDLADGNFGVLIHSAPFDAHKAEELISSGTIVIDGLENWQDKLLASDVCMQLRRPFIHAGGFGLRLQFYTMRPGLSACLRCVFPRVGIDDVPPNSLKLSYFKPLLAMIGAIQAIDAVKLVAEIGATQGNELWKFDFLSGEIETVRGLDPSMDCPDCGRFIR
ncbi:MAG TPA: ThiF family adenylyltransferase [Candidatus Obscuribacterales bacterium]